MDPIEWFNEKIENLNKGKNELEQIKSEIEELEKTVESLKSFKPTSGEVTFDFVVTNEENEQEPHSKTVYTFANDSDKKLMDDIRHLMIYEYQKRIGVLKERYNSYNPTIWERIWCPTDTMSNK